MAEPPEVAAARTEHPDCSFSTTRTDSFQLFNGQGRRSKQVDYYIQCPGERRQLIASQRSEDGVDVAADSREHAPFSERDSPSGISLADDVMRAVFGAARWPWGSEHASDHRGWPGGLRDPGAPAQIPWPFGAGRKAGHESESGSAGAVSGSSRRPAALPERHPPSFAERERGSGVSI